MRDIFISALILVIAMLLAPFVLTDYGIDLMTEIAIMAIFAMSLGLIMGYAGMLSLGHAAFFGIGSYTVALIGDYVTNTYLLLLASFVLAGIIALLTGAIFIRTSSFYFLMITLAFSQMLYAIIYQADWAGGSDGLSVSPSLNFGFAEIVDSVELYYTIVIAFIVFFTLLRFYVISPAGKITKGIMENEQRMKSLGYNTSIYKLLIYTISGAIAGIAGALYAYFNLFVSPDLTGWIYSGKTLVMVIIGGVGTLFGPALGAGVYIVLEDVISDYTERWLLILGVIIVALVLVGRGGIIHWLEPLGKMFGEKKKDKKTRV